MNDLVSLSELFVDKIFRIPDYQRGYAWTEFQLDDFWDDIDSLSDSRSHYTGMLSLKELTYQEYANWEEENWIIKDKNYKAFHVVDGQQRLTTFIICLNSLLVYAKAKNINYLNGDEIEIIKSKYIIETKKPENILKAYKFGYEKDNPSFEYLKHILGEESSGELLETFYTLNLEEASNFFYKKIDTLYIGKGKDGLETLFKKLVNQLKFNIHYIDDDFDVFVAFETMNNRGKKLSNLEILKNRLIYLTTIYDDSILNKDTKSQLRKDIDSAWKEVYRQLGRNKNNPLNDDIYLQNHWILFFKYSRNKGDDYVKFLLNQYFTPKAVYGLKRTLLLDTNDDNDISEDEDNDSIVLEESETTLTPENIKTYVDSLKTLAQFWYYSYNPEDCKKLSAEEIKWIQKLNRIKISYYRPLIVASLANINITAEQRLKLFKIIEKSIFVFFRMAQYRDSYQSSVAYKNAKELLHNEKEIDSIIIEMENHFNDNKLEAVRTFTNKMAGLFKNNDGYYSWKSLQYFFFEYEMNLYEHTFVSSLTDWKSFTKNEKDKISIEHIFPQTPNRWYWRNQFRDFTSKEERHQLTNSLGNLLALSQSVNSSLQNDDYPDKRNGNNKRKRGYKNGSQSEIEVADKYAEWTPFAIKERGLSLISFMEKRWDFTFDSDDERIKTLGIDFINDSRIISPELVRQASVSRSKEAKDFLESKEQQTVDIYDAMISELIKKIPDLFEEPANGAGYLAIKDSSQNNVAEVWFLKKGHLARINIYEPLNKDLLQYGDFEKESSNWVHKFRVYLRTFDDIKNVVDAILDSYDQV